MEPRDKLSMVFKKLQAAHTECLSRKNQLELDFLSKMKNYVKQRSQLELDYGLALQRLSHQSQMDPQICEELGYSNRSLYAVWNSYLEDCSKVGKQHQSLSHFYAQKMGDNLKVLFSNKTEAARKCFERLGKSHHYLQLAVKELEKSRRGYFTNRATFEESANKAEALREKLQKKSQSLFYSREQIEKELEKYVTRRDDALKQSIYFRNLYLIQLEAVKTHQEHYRNCELTELSQEIEQGLFDQIWTYLSAVVAIEKENYQTIEKAISALSIEVEQIMSPEEHHRSFLESDRSLKFPVLVRFEPCLHDKDRSLLYNAETEHAVQLEARKWLGSAMRHKSAIEDAKKKLHQLEQLQLHAWEARKTANSSQDAGMQELSRKIDEMRDGVRRELLMCRKAEAILLFFKNNGVEIDVLLIQPGLPAAPSVNAFQTRSRKSSLSQTSSDGSSMDPRAGVSYVILYDYEAQKEDELNLTQGEVVTLFEDPGEVPWPKGETSSGKIGLIPSNYIRRATMDNSYHSPRVSNASSSPRSPAVITSKTKDHGRVGSNKKAVFDLENQDEEPGSSVQDVETFDTDDFICWREAILEYDAEMQDEVSFIENDMIGVLGKQPNGVDDGWWLGHVMRTGQRGYFLEMMTRELGKTEANETLRRLHKSSKVKLRVKPDHHSQNRSTWSENQELIPETHMVPGTSDRSRRTQSYIN